MPCSLANTSAGSISAVAPLSIMASIVKVAVDLQCREKHAAAAPLQWDLRLQRIVARRQPDRDTIRFFGTTLVVTGAFRRGSQ
jgi:hypothetical protein